MKGLAWKFAGVLILLAVIIAAIVVPLGPGIISVSPNRATEGQSLALEIRGHSTGFRANEPIQGWLLSRTAFDTITLCAKKADYLSDSTARLHFDIPANIIAAEDNALVLDCLVGSATSGTVVLRNAVIVDKDTAYTGNRVKGSFSQCNFKEIERQAGTFDFPFRENLFESIRNLFFHVPMWFVMMALYFASCFYCIRYLRRPNERYDLRAVELANTGTLFGLLGMATGMIWAKFTWGDWWSNDPKQTSTAILLLIYFAYFVLRSSINEEQQRARVSAVYNLFAAATIIPLLYIIPNQDKSLHPGDGSNSPFSDLDLDDRLRMIFYPACAGWIVLGFWLANLRSRFRSVQNRILENE